jgi:hypothetical protein
MVRTPVMIAFRARQAADQGKAIHHPPNGRELLANKHPIDGTFDAPKIPSDGNGRLGFSIKRVEVRHPAIHP